MSQTDRLLSFLEDHEPHRSDVIVREVYGPQCPLSRLSARIWDLKQKGHEIIGWKDKNPVLYWYQLRGCFLGIPGEVGPDTQRKATTGPIAESASRPFNQELFPVERWTNY